MYSAAVLGDRETILAFKTLGFVTVDVEDTEQAKHELKKLAKSQIAIIYVTEQLYMSLEKEIDEYIDSRLPAIIPIPNREGSLGIGLSNVKKSVERAVGADILFGGEK